MRSKIGVSEEFFDLDEMLSDIHKARADLKASKVAEKSAERERKKSEEATGALMVERSLTRRSSPGLHDSIYKKDVLRATIERERL